MNSLFIGFLLVLALMISSRVFAQNFKDSGVLVSSSDAHQRLDQTSKLNNEDDEFSDPRAESDTQADVQENASTEVLDDIIVKSTKVVMVQITANIKLTQDQIGSVQSIIQDNIIKLRQLQLSLQRGEIDAKIMFAQRQGLINDENKKLGHVFTSDQMRVWLNIQDS